MVEFATDDTAWVVVETRLAGLSTASIPAVVHRCGEAQPVVGRGGVDRTTTRRHVRGALWPSMGWTMRGVVALCTSDTLVYSWTWGHEPDQPARSVIVHGAEDDGGTVLTITQGPYRPSSPSLLGEDEERAGHSDGWLQLLPELHEAIAQEHAGRDGH